MGCIFNGSGCAMSEQNVTIPSNDPREALPSPAQVLSYAKPRQHVAVVLQIMIIIVSVANLATGAMLTLIALRDAKFLGPLYASAPAMFGPLLIVCGGILCFRTEWWWRRCFELLMGSSI